MLTPFWRYQVCLKLVFLNWFTEKPEFKSYCWWELLLCLMRYTEGNRSRLNEILERTREGPGVMELVMIWQCHAQVLIFSSSERWLLALTKERGLKGGGENKIFSVFVKPKQLMGNLEKIPYNSLPLPCTVKKMTDWLVKHRVAVQEEWWGEIKKATKNKSSEAGTINQLLE